MQGTPSEIGARTEAAVARALTFEGWDVCLPVFCAHSRVDLVALRGNETLRVQCKTAMLLKNVLYFRTCSNTKNIRRPYHGEVDVFGVYSPDMDKVYLVPLDGLGDAGCYLRLRPTANNQAKGIRYAADYEIGHAAPPERLKLV